MDRRGRIPRVGARGNKLTEDQSFPYVLSPTSLTSRARSVEPKGATNRGTHRHSSTSRTSRHQAEHVKEILDSDRRGVVATVNHGFGFITVAPAEGKTMYSKNLFVHQSSLIDANLTVGQRMKFDVAEGKKGYEAINVLKDTEETADSEILNRNVSIEEVGYLQDRRGEVISYNVVYRYGIVKCFDNDITLIVHHTRFKPPLTEIAVGQVLKFDITEGPKGACADNIEVVADVSPCQDPLPSKSSSIGEGESSKRDSNLKQVMSDEFQCCICLKLLSKDAVMTNCDHYFCKLCIERWISERSRCPMCSARVKKDDLKPLPRAFKNLLESIKNSK